MKDWGQIEAIFGEALALAPEARNAYLNRACSDRPALRAEVESLLASDAEASPSFLGAPVDPQALPLPPPPAAGETVGTYRLVERLGEGGMGTVYAAVRADGAFERQVAVKVLRAGLTGEAARQRFDLERRILAGLDHPGIARLLDGGTTAAGSPFVVMERVDGTPIDRYCEEHALSAAARVDLVIEVCDAVAAAHRSLVVHRDLKPSNVLVDSAGQTKLLDFGIAKILDPEQAEALGTEAGATTVGWQRMLTPNYASPEQVRGERITVATDVYLLGILLYKLLTGQLPHRLKDRSLAEVEAILSHQIPQTPSRRLLALSRPDPLQDREAASPPAGVTRIDPDLDHIILKALRGEPADRYASVEALAADLRRQRAGLPIQARAGNRRYRLRKFVVRYRRALAVAALGVLLLSLFAADRALQVQRHERALVRAEDALARSETLRSFVEGLFWNADPAAAKGRSLTVAEALGRGETKLANMEVGSPATRASLHALLGRIRFDLGQVDEARSHLERALETFGALDAPEAAERVSALRARGDLALARFQQLEAIDAPNAEATIDLALSEARRVYEASRGLAEDDPVLALELSSPLAEIYCWLGRWDDAAPLTREARALARRAGEPKSASVALALARHALILKNRDEDLQGARQLYGRALDIFRELEGPVHPEVANIHNQLALVAEALGDRAGALAAHRETLAVRRQLYDGAHWEISQSLEHLGELLLEGGDSGSAVEHFAEMVQVNIELYGPLNSRTVRRTLLWCQALIVDGQFAAAEALARAQLDAEHRVARPAGSRLLVWAEGILGAALLAQGRDEGRVQLAASIDTLRAKSRSYEAPLTWLEAQRERFVAAE